MKIQGAHVLITGAASGIGRHMALGVAQRGGILSLLDLNQDGLETLVLQVRNSGGTAEGFLCDVGNRTAVYDIARQVVKAVGAVDILINNAGIVSGQNLLEIPDEKIEESFRVNTLSLFWTTKAFLPEMIQRNRGHLVTIASASGIIGVARLTDYSATKWAAVGFDESLRVELKKTAPGVKTTVICPYYIDTGMFDGVRSRFPFLLPILKEKKVAERILKTIERNQPRLVLPLMVQMIPWLRILPLSWFDAIANLIGVNSSMDNFKGRQQ